MFQYKLDILTLDVSVTDVYVQTILCHYYDTRYMLLMFQYKLDCVIILTLDTSVTDVYVQTILCHYYDTRYMLLMFQYKLDCVIILTLDTSVTDVYVQTILCHYFDTRYMCHWCLSTYNTVSLSWHYIQVSLMFKYRHFSGTILTPDTCVTDV